MKVLVGYIGYVMVVLAVLAYFDDQPARIDTLRLQKNFWLLGTTGVNTPDRGVMNSCLESYDNGSVKMTDCRGTVFRTLRVHNGVVDFEMQATMTVVVRHSQRTGRLTVHRKTIV